MKRKLLLISPLNQRRKGMSISWDARYRPLGLGIIAALTPDHWDIKIIDENFDTFEYEDADLVGFTAFTSSAFRVYELAKLYKDKGIKTVMGGIHASMVPDEAEKYVDTVVVGEAESVWAKLLADFEAGNMQTRYLGEQISLDQMPVARHDLFHKDYLFGSVQTTRGCPSDCEFCSVHVFNGHVHRLRPVEDILNELEQIPQRLIFFVDDNIIGYSKKSRDRAISLFKGMVDRKLNKLWFSQTSMNIAEDKEVLKWAKKSGCKTILIGIESEAEEALSETNKQVNLRVGVNKYKKQFKKIQRMGIPVMGTFIFGMDSDSLESLKKRTDFILNCGVDSVQASILTPLPGTRLYEKYDSSNRLTATNYPFDWQKYHFGEPVIQPEKISDHDLYRTMWTNWARIYNIWELRRRLLRTFWRTRSFSSAWWSYVANWHYRRIWFETLPILPDDRKSKNYKWVMDLKIPEDEATNKEGISVKMKPSESEEHRYNSDRA
ncbi:MAG: B12-binding domain-containing radical SAM protein [Bacteroidales bacterium]|nr:B12-binding domain-containing radical SAM protein [Bacteroidales bacterium]